MAVVAVAALATWWSQPAEPTHQQPFDSLPKAEINAAEETTVNEASTSQHSVFRSVDEETTRRLQPWLDDVYIPSLGDVDAVIRVQLANVRSEELSAQLRRSWKLQEESDPRKETGLDVSLDLFPDTKYSVITSRFKVDSSGFENFTATIVNKQSDGREYFKFEIAPDGRIFGRGVTPGTLYQISPTPDQSVVVIAALDEIIVSSSIAVD